MRIPLFCIATVILVACYQSKETDAPSLENNDRSDIDDSRIESDAESGRHCTTGSTDPECTVEPSTSTDNEINKGERLFDLFRGTVEMFCQCIIPDDDSCTTNFNGQFGQAIDCIVDTLNKEGKEVEVYVDCITEHLQALSTCAQQYGCDSLSSGQCESEMAAGFGVFGDSCDEYPNPVYPEMLRCYIPTVVGDPGGEVTCLNGETILYGQICDGEPDCSDGSDEMYAYCRL